MEAVVIATGDELVRGSHADTNSALVARALASLSLECRRFVVLGDDEDALVEELSRCLSEGVVAVVGGGLGPTLDDVTRAAFARALATTLERDATVDARLRDLFAARGREYSESNARQAMFPLGARILRNERGTADGFACARGSALLVALPGPPRELEPMLRGEVLDLVRAHLARHAPDLGVALSAVFKLSRLPESRFADLCGDWMARGRNPLVGVTASAGVLTATIRARGRDGEEAGALLAAQAGEFRQRFAEWIHAEGEVDLETLLVEELRARRATLALAESCTGGMVSARVTRVPGASSAFLRGWTTYSNAAKVDDLGVPPALLEAHGAVSAEVASAMALGAARRSGARLTLSITGIAGPDGGSPAKPVGLVWMAVCVDGVVAAHERRYLALGRDLVREFATRDGLWLLLEAARGLGSTAPMLAPFIVRAEGDGPA
jgi:nicotinamide-nucleotide amidase